MVYYDAGRLSRIEALGLAYQSAENKVVGPALRSTYRTLIFDIYIPNYFRTISQSFFMIFAPF